MTGLVHNYSNLAGKTVLWDTSDNEEAYRANTQDPIKRQQLQDLGYLDCDITYSFNRDGFRNAEFDRPIDVVCFGCSFTMGTGVQMQDTWPAQLQALTNLEVANLGHAGSSNDTAFRFADYYLPQLRPKFAVWVQTDNHRLEIIDQVSRVSVNILATDSDDFFSNNHFIKTWMTSEQNQTLNQKKNTGAFVNLCRDLGIVPVVLPRQDVVTVDTGRDLRHPGIHSYRAIAEKIKNLISVKF
jgi:hypothetical protein